MNTELRLNAKFTEDGMTLTVDWEHLVEHIDDSTRRTMLAYLACDATIFDWCVDMLAHRSFEPDDERTTLYGWSTDSGTIERARSRLDSMLPAVANRRITDLEIKAEHRYNQGAADAINQVCTLLDARVGSSLRDRLYDLLGEIQKGKGT